MRRKLERARERGEVEGGASRKEREGDRPVSALLGPEEQLPAGERAGGGATEERAADWLVAFGVMFAADR